MAKRFRSIEIQDTKLTFSGTIDGKKMSGTTDLKTVNGAPTNMKTD